VVERLGIAAGGHGLSLISAAARANRTHPAASNSHDRGPVGECRDGALRER
jgi:hypothetical protein